MEAALVTIEWLKFTNSVSGARRCDSFWHNNDYDICYRRESNKGSSDGLSILPIDKCTYRITGDLAFNFRDIAEDTKNGEMLNYIETDNWPKLMINKEVLEFHRRIWN